MDPDGLSILITAVSAVIALAAAFATGAVGASDADRSRRTPLGFSAHTAGLFTVFVFACAFFVFGLLRLLRQPAWGLLCVAALCAAAVFFFALGLARGAGFAAAFPRAGRLPGAIFAAPARLLFGRLHLAVEWDVTEDALLSMVDDVEEQALIDETQKEMIANIFELDDVTAGEIMTHRTEVKGVPDTATAAEVVQLAGREGVSRMPVYRKSIDDIVGIVYVKDLFSAWNDPRRSELPVRKFVRSAMFVPEACRARELLVEFRAKRTQIAIVVDEYGGTSGVVTMEDVLEEIVGNIQDEFDNEEEELVRTDDGLIAAGSADLEDVFEAFDMEAPENDEDDFDSVGGLVTDRLGRIPAEGETVSVPYGGLLFTVLKAGERRVDKVKCTRMAQSGEREE